MRLHNIVKHLIIHWISWSKWSYALVSSVKSVRSVKCPLKCPLKCSCRLKGVTDRLGPSNDHNVGYSQFVMRNRLATSVFVSTNNNDNMTSDAIKIIKNDKRRKGKKVKNNMKKNTTSFLQKKTQQLLRETSVDEANIENNSDPHLVTGLKKSRKTFGWLIDAWRIHPGGAAHAESLLRRMEEMDERNSKSAGFQLEPMPSFSPDVRIFTKVINALARSGQPNSGERAEGILNRMEHLAETGKNPSAKPNTLTYTAVIEAYANSGNSGNSGDAARKADRLCRKMESLYLDGNEDVQPTARTFHSLILAWSRSGEPGAADYAHDILQHMQELGQTEEQASCKPSASSFNAVIDAYAKSGEPHSVQKAEQILNQMEHLYKTTKDATIKPNIKTYNSLLNAYAKSGDADAAYKAEDLLIKMEKMYEAGNEDVSPDVTSFSTVINAWARSHNFGKAEHALKILKQMSELYAQGKNKNAKPNVIIFNSVMNACAFTVGNELEQVRALNIAHTMLKELQSSPYGDPDAITYGTYLKVCANQMPDGDLRSNIVQAAFKKCCKDGQVGDLVLQQLRLVAPPELYRELIGRSNEEHITVEDIPLSWKCNVTEKFRRKRHMR